MSELKVYHCNEWHNEYTEFYIKSEADKVIAELKNRIAPKQSDKTLQDRLNEVCKKHAVSTLQDLDWAFCMTEARLEDYAKLASQLVAQKHEALEKMLQYKVLYKEMCRDINTQERFFAMKVAHANYKRCLDNAWWCLREEFFAEDCHCEQWVDWAIKWYKRWLAIAEKFKEEK